MRRKLIPGVISSKSPLLEAKSCWGSLGDSVVHTSSVIPTEDTSSLSLDKICSKMALIPCHFQPTMPKSNEAERTSAALKKSQQNEEKFCS
jgi:hypothetical protein